MLEKYNKAKNKKGNKNKNLEDLKKEIITEDDIKNKVK